MFFALIFVFLFMFILSVARVWSEDTFPVLFPRVDFRGDLTTIVRLGGKYL